MSTIRYLIPLLILFVFFFNSDVKAACPSGADGQTVNILSGDNCTSRISNPGSSVTVAGNLTVNSGDGAIYYNFNSHTVNITGTVTNTNTGTSHGIHDVTGSTGFTQTVTISGNGSVNGTAADYYNQGSTVNLTNNQSDLTFKGLVPSSYKILIEGTTDFGKTTFVSPTGTLTFDIATASSISSTGTYSAVLDDIPSSNISSTRTGTFGSYNWTLQLASGFSDRWDLVISDPPPTLSSSTPADNATDVARDANIILNFSESVDVKSGNITIKKTSDDSTIETIDVISGQVTGTGTSKITINPSSDLFGGFEYYVLIDATAFDDSAGNSYAGISSTTALSFTVVDMQDPTTNKDIVGSIDSQSLLAKSFITQSTSTVSNRLDYLRQNKDNQDLSKQNIKLDFGNAILTSLTNELLAKNDKSIIPDNWSSWSEGSLSSSKIGDSANSSSSETDRQALAFGFDTKLNDNDLLGFAIQYGKSDTDVGSSGSKTDSENINFSVYRTRPLDNDNFIEGMFGVGLIESDLTRISGSNTLTGSRNGTQIFGSINYGKTIDKGDFNLTPIARVDLGYTELDAYSESGTDALSYAKQTIESGLASVGLQFSDIVKFNNNKLKPFGSIEYGMDFSNSSDAKMNYVSDTSTIYNYTQGANSNHLITSVVGFEYITINNLNIIASYKRIQGNESEQTDILNVSINFKSKRETEYAMSIDGAEDLKAGFDITKNVNGFDLKFNANHSLSENSDQAANISLSRSF